MGRLDGKVALVTGAGRGVGRGIALALASEGARVAIVELDSETAAETAAACEARGVDAIALPCDIRTRAACEDVVARTQERFGALDTLVCNAMAGRTALPFAAHEDADMEQHFRVSLMASFWLMSAAHPALAAGRGSIITVSSTAGTEGMAGFAAYAASKEALRCLTKVAAREWGPAGIRANNICPFADSPGMLAWTEEHPRAHAKQLEGVPLRRIGRCEEDIGRAVAFLASDDAAFVTAQTMLLDGGGGSFR